MPDYYVLSQVALASENTGFRSASLTWQLAVAEALHVDGFFAEAIELWKRAWISEPSGDIAFRTAVSLIALRADDGEISAWLNEADAQGVARSSTSYVRAQWELLRGNASKAYEMLGESAENSVDALTLRSMIDARLGRLDNAKRATRAALAIDAEDGCALCSAVALGLFGDAWKAALRRSAALQPERAEPLLLAARKVDDEALRATLSAAAGWRGPSCLARQLHTKPVQAQATIRLCEGKLIAHCHWKVFRDQTPSSELLAGSGVSVTIGPEADLLLPVECSGDRYQISNAWRETEDGLDLHFAVSHVVDTARASEFETPYAWLPTPLPPIQVDWTLEVVGDWDFDFIVAPDPMGIASPTGIGFADPARVRGKHVEAIAAQQSVHLARAVAVADCAFPLWPEVMGVAPPADRPVIAVTASRSSSVCFTRRNLIRVPLKVAADPEQVPVLVHEVGHLWWGAGIAFERESRWLAEALAEFTLHLAEDRAIVEDYRSRTRRAIIRLLRGGGYDLEGLAHSTSAESAYLLRAIGGFVISMLRQTLGDERFSAWASLLMTSDTPIVAYDAFAMAGWLHGHSLNAFVNQWIAADTIPIVSVTACETSESPRGQRIELSCRISGGTLPEVRLPAVLNFYGDARPMLISFDLALGEDNLTVDCPARLAEIVIDPEARFLLMTRTEKME
jgi:hypothetical protein